MDSGGERLGGQMFGRCRRVLSVLLLIYILWRQKTGDRRQETGDGNRRLENAKVIIENVN